MSVARGEQPQLWKPPNDSAKQSNAMHANIKVTTTTLYLCIILCSLPHPSADQQHPKAGQLSCIETMEQEATHTFRSHG